MQRFLIFLYFVAFAAAGRAQTLDPADYVYPVCDVDGSCSANFGEMRPGHFHAGVDIRTGGVEGKPLVAVADGYVSRISVAPGGYGRAIYLTLRNGTTAVYGHLQRFRDDIEQYLAHERRTQCKNRLNLFFGPEAWPVAQGDPIGFSGNSGSSMGPHLHFEVRDTPTQRLYNIVHEGIIRPADTLAPRIVKVHYIEIDSLPGGLCVHRKAESYAAVRLSEGNYKLTRSEPVPVGRKGYFVVETTDRRNGVHNTFGVWRVTARIDGEPYFEYRMDGFTFDRSRCCDAVSCYPMQIATRNEAIRLAQLEAAPDCFYTTMTDRGVIRAEPGQMRRLGIEVEDDSDNISTLEFAVCGREEEFRAEADTMARIARPGGVTILKCGPQLTARIPAGALHETVACRPQQVAAPAVDSGVVVLSPAFRVLPAATPLRRMMTVSIRAEVPEHLRLHASLARLTPKGKAAYAGGTFHDGVVSASTYTSDPLFVAADFLPPTIVPRFVSGADLSRQPSLGFRVSDNFSGVASYTLRIDDEWVPCDSYPMKGRLEHVFDTAPTHTVHSVQLIVRDAAGNAAHWQGTYYR